MAILHTRQDYMTGKVSHKEYYAQFNTPELTKLVSKYKDKLSLDDNGYVQGLELRYWDAMAYNVPPRVLLAIKEANGIGVSLSDRVCALKASARILLQSNVS